VEELYISIQRDWSKSIRVFCRENTQYTTFNLPAVGRHNSQVIFNFEIFNGIDPVIGNWKLVFECYLNVENWVFLLCKVRGLTKWPFDTQSVVFPHPSKSTNLITLVTGRGKETARHSRFSPEILFICRFLELDKVGVLSVAC
jgi:hypothetical protein